MIALAKANKALKSQKQLIYTPVGFRDTSVMVSNSRDNAHQTGTTRLHIFPQFDCEDIVLVYTNYWQGASTSPTPNTNAINVKSSVEINGVLIPVFFGGKRTVTIEGGGVVYSDPIGCIITSSDSVFIRTYFDAGVGGYIPLNGKLVQISGVQDGVTFGSDLTDSGTPTNTTYTNSYVPSMILGVAKGTTKSFLLSGDSIIDGNGDEAEASLGNTGFAARRFLTDDIGTTKISMAGDSAVNFINNLYMRAPLIKNHTGVICNYGTNDIYGAGTTLANLQSALLKIWKYFATKGLDVYHTTILPKTTSTDLWATLTNQTILASENTRLGLNAWLRDTSNNGAVAQSKGNLKKVIDIALAVETNGKWSVFTTPIFSGTVKTAGTNYITDSALPFALMELNSGALIKITGGTGAGQVLQVYNNSYGATTVYTKTNWTTIPDATSTYELYRVLTYDGTHPSAYGHKVLAAAVNV